MSLADRFLYYVRKADSGCWEWIGGSDKDGYGVFAMPGHDTWRAPRAAYRIFVGDPAGSKVLHSCDSPGCVNPAHLCLGTTADNNRDRDTKGRQARGERTRTAKLTDQMVRDIRRLHSEGVSRPILAAVYEVNFSTVTHVVNRTTWKHVE